MVVDSYLELFTTLFGWLWYGAIWDVLEETNILILPFLGIVLDKYIEYRKGDEDGINEEVILRGLEVDLGIAMVVLLFVGKPFLPLEASEVAYAPKSVFPVVLGEPSPVTADTSGTTYGSVSFVDAPNQVLVPFFPYAIFNISVGIGRAVQEAVPHRDDLRYYTEQLLIASVEDPKLREEVNNFYRDCYIPALSKYTKEKPEGGLATSILADYGVSDPYWIGSHSYINLDGYYNALRSASVQPPFLYSPLRDVEWDSIDPNRPVYGKPFCNEWWDTNNIGLKDRMLETQSVLTGIAAVVESGWDSTKREDGIVKNMLRNGPPEWMPRGYDYAYTNITRPDGSIEAAGERIVKGLGAGIGSVVASIGKSFEITIFLQMSHQIQSLVLMFIIIFTPFVLFLSKFDLGAALVMAWVMFTIKFLTVVWYMVWWIDQNLFYAMYPDPGMVTELGTLVGSNKRILLNYITTTLYYVAPILFVLVSGWGGYNVLNGIMSLKNQLVSGAKAAASQAGNKVVGAAMKGGGKVLGAGGAAGSAGAGGRSTSVARAP